MNKKILSGKNDNMKKENISKLKIIFIGIIAGIINGLFATGGGMLLVPFFLYILKLDDLVARATSGFCIVPMVITSGLIYSINEKVNLKLCILCIIGGIIGGIIGTKLLGKISKKILKILFIVFLLYAAYNMLK